MSTRAPSTNPQLRPTEGANSFGGRELEVLMKESRSLVATAAAVRACVAVRAEDGPQRIILCCTRPKRRLNIEVFERATGPLATVARCGLSGKGAFVLLDSHVGIERVLDTFSRIEHGTLA
jgi:hypothetical protein